MQAQLPDIMVVDDENFILETIKMIIRSLDEGNLDSWEPRIEYISSGTKALSAVKERLQKKDKT